MISLEQQDDYLLASYFSHDGQVAREKITIPPREQFNWVVCDPADPECDKKFVSLSGHPVKKKPGRYLTKFRHLEIIHSLPQLTLDRIFSAHKPKKYFMDIETSMKFGIPPNKMVDDPRESILTNCWCDEEGNITATGTKELTIEQINSIEKRINKHFEKINRTYKFTYKLYPSEEAMLTDLIYYHIPKMPFISGWNFDAFDWAYIMARSEVFKIDTSKTSPTGKMEKVMIKRKFAKKGEGVRTKKPLHRAIVDYQALYERWDTSVAIKESAKLDYVGQEVFGVKKVEYSGTLTELYNNDFELYVFYNAVDTALVEVIDRKLNTFSIMIKLSQRAKVPLSHSMYMSLALTSLMSKKAYERGIVLLADDLVAEEDEKYPGGYVKEPGTGMFFDVDGFDFASLFPSIMMAFNISTDSFVGKMNPDGTSFTDLKGKKVELTDQYIRCASNAVFVKDKSSIMRDILIDLIDIRLLAKNTANEIDAEVRELEKLLKEKQGIAA